MFAYRKNNEWVEWNGDPVTKTFNGVTETYNLTYNDAVRQDADELASFGLSLVQDVPIPDGKRVVAQSLHDVGGTPVIAYSFEDIPPAIPEVVSAAQAKVALYNFDNGPLFNTIEAMVNHYPYPPVRIWYQSANIWERSNPYVAALAVEANLTDEQVDALFVAASKLA